MSMKLDRRAFLGTALTFGALCSMSPTEAFGVTSAEKKAEVKEIKAKLDAMTDELDSAVDEYNKAQDAYNKAKEKVANAKKEISEAQSKIDDLQGRLSTRATSMYRNGAMSYLDVLLGVGSFDDFATVWDTLNTLNEDDADLVTETKQTKAKLETAKKELDEQKNEAADQYASAKAYNKKISNLVDEYEREYNSLSAEYKKLLEKEKEEEEARKAAAAAAYSPTTTSSSNDTSTSTASDTSSSSSNNTSSSSSDDDDDDSSSSSSSSSSSGSSGSSLPTNGGVVDFARYCESLHTPYVWGGSTPGKGMDCSGLTMWCYAQVGISIDHYTESQYSQAKARLSVYSASAGDILYRSGHVAIYAGGDSYIHAPHSGTYVQTASGIGSFSAALRF